MMWSPTHVQILIRSAKDLKIKGNDGTNDAFVTIDLGYSKFQTSVKPGSKDFIEWFELCEMKLPKQYNDQMLTLTAYHKNLISTDQFLGTISIPLNRFLDFQKGQKAYKTKVTKCYRLTCKPGQTKTDYRGELEVGITFIMKSECTQSLDEPSLRKLSKDVKHMLSTSTLSLNQNHHLNVDHCSKESDQCDNSSKQLSKDEYSKNSRGYLTIKRKVTKSNLCLSSEEAENFLIDRIDYIDFSSQTSHSNSFQTRNQGIPSIDCPLKYSVDPTRTQKSVKEIHNRFQALSKDNLIDIIIDFHQKVIRSERRELELEEYIDCLTAKVLETAPDILKSSGERTEKM